MKQPTIAEIELALKQGLFDAQKSGDTVGARNIARLLSQVLEVKERGQQ